MPINPHQILDRLPVSRLETGWRRASQFQLSSPAFQTFLGHFQPRKVFTSIPVVSFSTEQKNVLPEVQDTKFLYCMGNFENSRSAASTLRIAASLQHPTPSLHLLALLFRYIP